MAKEKKSNTIQEVVTEKYDIVEYM